MTTAAPAEPPPEPPPARGLFATFGLLVGVVTLGVAAVSAVNTAFDLELQLSTYGASTPLPDSWEIVIGLVAAGVLILGLTFFGSAVSRLFRNAKGRPIVRIGIVLGALALLVGVGRGVQIAALLSTYGSMLAYLCTDVGTVQEVKEELDDDPDAEALDRCMYRAAQWGRTDLLAPVVAAGGDFRDATSPKEHRRCVLHGAGVDAAFATEAIRLGASPETCPASDALIHYRVSAARKGDDAETAALVTALAKGGWSVDATPDFSKKSPRELAASRKLKATVAALAELEGAGASKRVGAR